ncbi:MAG: NIPSNAP family protein [Dehalococcoidia bacterium]
MIYLNETYTIHPGKLDRHVQGFVNDLAPAMERHDARLLGLWQTWRVNELHAFWELDDHTALDRLDAAAQDDDALASYARRAAEERVSWRARTLRPTPFSPDLARIKAEGIKGEIYLLAVIPLNPGKMQEYLELFPQYGLVYEERYGLKTVGYWTGGGGEPYQSEAFVCTQLCAGGNWAWWARFSEHRAKDAELQAWMKRALNYRTHHKISYLVPAYLPY